MSQPTAEHAGARPVHPLLIGAFPIISLLGHNIIEISALDGLRALVISILLVGLVWLVARLVSRWTWGQAGLVASLFAILFFSYGHVYSFVEGASLLGVRVGRHMVLGPIWLGLFIAAVWGLRKLRDTSAITSSLNVVGLVLLVFPLYQIAAHEITLISSQSRLEQPARGQPGGLESQQPDIYYLILDAYTRDDTLLEVFDSDNTPFLQALEERGFVIPRCTRSNYGRTFLSTSSSLNMNYVQAFAPYNGPGELTAMIKDNAVRQRLSAQGYTVVAFDAGFFRTQWPDADLWLPYETEGGGLWTNEFETLAINTTGLLFLLDGNIFMGGSPLAFVYETSRVERFNRVNYIFDTLEDMPPLAGPVFVWAHVPSPHSPFVFTADGSFSSAPDDSLEGYRDQVAYINQRVLAAVDAILARSETPPIIIIQGDHGASENYADYRRLHILNAYHLPGEASGRIYPTITPVNTFRLIFNAYFGEDLDLLPDVSYFSPPDQDYAFEVAPESRPGCGE